MEIILNWIGGYILLGMVVVTALFLAYRITGYIEGYFDGIRGEISTEKTEASPMSITEKLKWFAIAVAVWPFTMAEYTTELISKIQGIINKFKEGEP